MNCPNCRAPVDDDAAQCPACGTQLDATFHRPPPTTAGDGEVIGGQWQIEKKLGQGGMGSVYLAKDLSLGRRVAIKMLSAQLTDNAELVARFEREARMMARLDHPNLVPVYAVGRREKTPFIVMKFLEGLSLGDYLVEHGRLSPEDAMPIVQQLAEGLQFVHDNGVVHRDLKPANVFVSPSGHVTLLDLGVARDTEQNMTRTGMLVGTPRYMSPEQILGKRVEHTSDLYSLGTLVFELLTGAPVFEGESDFSLMKAHVDQAPPDLASMVSVPPEVNEVLQKALAKDPAARFQSAREFASALGNAVRDVTRARAPTRPPSTVSRPLSRATPAPVPKGPTPPPSKFKPPSRPPSVQREGPRVDATLISSRKTDPAEAAKAAPREEPELDAAAIAAARPSRLPLIGVLLGLVIVVLSALLVLKPWAAEAPNERPVPREVEPPPVAKIDAPPPDKAEAPPPEKVEPPPVAKVDPPPVAKVDPPPVAKVEPVTEKPVVPVPDKKPPVADRKPLIAKDAPVTFLFRVKGMNVAAFVDVDGIRQRTTPLQVRLPAGKHSVAFISEGRPPQKREINVVAGEPQKVLVEVDQ